MVSRPRCKPPQLKYLEVGEEEEQDELSGEVVEEHKVAVEKGDKQELVTLSLSSMVGLTAERSMKMMGHIGGKQVVVLIDSGATRNFISERLVQKMGLPVTETKGFGVRLGEDK